MYADTFGSLDVAAFADRLWGDIYFNAETRKFTRKAADPEQSRTFVHFILDPLYKLYSHVLSEDTEDLKSTLASLNISLKPIMYKMDVRPLLKAILDQFFGPATGLVDMIAEHIPSPLQGTTSKVWVFQYFLINRIESGIGRADIHWPTNFRDRCSNESLRY
jgi:U5 small nuclear ribonucleoprotein component